MKMDFIPDRLLKGIAGNKRVVPNPNGWNTPTTTSVANGSKITHALGKLAQAGVAGEGATAILGLPTTTSTTYPQKITHMVEKLTNAGLADSDDTVSTTSKSSHGLATKYIIAIGVISAVILLVLLAGGFFCFRRYKRRRAYNVVSRGIDNKKGKGPMREKEDMFNADMGEAESFNVDGQKLTERNFESGYDKVDTGYEGSAYGGVDEAGGDKRARLEA